MTRSFPRKGLSWREIPLSVPVVVLGVSGLFDKEVLDLVRHPEGGALFFRLVLAGWFLFLFCRVHGLGRIAAFTGGLAWSATARMALPGPGSEWLLPGVLLAVACHTTRGRPGDLLFLAGMVFAVLMVPPPGAAFPSLLPGGLYFVVRILSLPAHKRWPRIWRGVLALLLGVGPALPRLIPCLEAPPGTDAFRSPWQMVPAWLIPDFFLNAGTSLPQPHLFLGTAIPVLALTALARNTTLYLKWFTFAMLFLACSGLLLLPGAHWLSSRSGISHLFPTRCFAAQLCFFFALAAALGFDTLSRSPPRTAARLLSGTSAAVGVLVAVFASLWRLGFLGDFARVDPFSPHLGHLPLMLSTVLLLGVFLAVRPAWKWFWFTLLALLLFMDIHLHLPDTAFPSHPEI